MIPNWLELQQEVAALRASQVHHVEDSGCTCRSCLLRERDALKAAGQEAIETIDGNDLDGYDNGVSDFASLRAALKGAGHAL